MLSIPHLIIIFVVALVVFGPEKLPELARNLGKVMAEFKRATGELRSTFEGHMRDLEREADTRRIGGPTATLPAPTPVGEPAPASVPGTVTTLPAHFGAPIEGQSVTPAETTQVIEIEKPQPQSTGPIEEPDATEAKSETVSDGGTRPA